MIRQIIYSYIYKYNTSNMQFYFLIIIIIIIIINGSTAILELWPFLLFSLSYSQSKRLLGVGSARCKASPTRRTTQTE
jgi:hypothetical protein